MNKYSRVVLIKIVCKFAEELYESLNLELQSALNLERSKPTSRSYFVVSASMIGLNIKKFMVVFLKNLLFYHVHQPFYLVFSIILFSLLLAF